MSEEVVEFQGQIHVPYEWAYGEDLTRFFEGTKQKKIYGSRCPSCKGVMVPPTSYCARCYVPMEGEWIELPHTAKIDSFTVVHLPFVGQPTEPPYAYATIIVDGSDGYYLHVIGECDFDELHCDMKVEAVWNPEPKGDLYDILYWRPVKGDK
jgi:uncharacterized OB-fold protein